MTEPADRRKAFRDAIAAFIEARREAKLKGKEDDDDTASKYDYSTWLADAARRVGQIQAVTHVLKATHPDAKGSSLHVVPGTLEQHADIGTHILGDDFAEDVVGNAAALDVFKFLKIEVEGGRLLDWMQAEDADLRHALHQDEATASGWMQEFRNLVRTPPQPASHEVAKQLYWLTGTAPADDDQYHLLQPLFSSSLAHAVHEEVQDARFGEANKAARQARRDGHAHDAPYRSYPDLAVRKLGGTKPQNISQLNSERGGVNYLLASLPPRWKQAKPRSLKIPDDVWSQFQHFGEVSVLLKSLIDLLKRDPDPNMDTRIAREDIEQALGAYLPAFADFVAETREPGWTRQGDHELPLEMQIWLDPRRVSLAPRTDNEQQAKDDVAFEAAYEWKDWPDEIAGRFAHWLNARLRDAGITDVGDSEAKHWARQAIVEADWPATIQRRMPTGDAA